jgi:hypothetical protein
VALGVEPQEFESRAEGGTRRSICCTESGQEGAAKGLLRAAEGAPTVQSQARIAECFAGSPQVSLPARRRSVTPVRLVRMMPSRLPRKPPDAAPALVDAAAAEVGAGKAALPRTCAIAPLTSRGHSPCHSAFLN